MFKAFTTLRIYGMSGRSWRVLVVVAPLALIRPVLTVVRRQHTGEHTVLYNELEGGHHALYSRRSGSLGMRYCASSAL